MPTYQYACTEPACGERFERVQAFTDPAITECPVCSGSVRKVFSAVGVVFKGSGFYRTDSRDSKGKASTTSESSKKDSGSKESTTSGSSTSDSSSSSSSSSSSNGGSSSSSTGSGSSSTAKTAASA